VLAADLDERDVGEPGLGVGPDRLDEGVDVRAAGDRLGDVLGAYELGGTGEASEFTIQPPPNQRNWSWARLIAASRSGS
jgi:hypothetical protein